MSIFSAPLPAAVSPFQGSNKSCTAPFHEGGWEVQPLGLYTRRAYMHSRSGRTSPGSPGGIGIVLLPQSRESERDRESSLTEGIRLPIFLPGSSPQHWTPRFFGIRTPRPKIATRSLGSPGALRPQYFFPPGPLPPPP